MQNGVRERERMQRKEFYEFLLLVWEKLGTFGKRLNVFYFQ